MKLKFWGIRGSNYVYKPENIKYGCNTTCIEVNDDEDNIIIFDAGTGIYNLCEDILKRDITNKTIHLLFTHAHWDHIQGLQSFSIFFKKNWTINLYAVKNFGQTGVEALFHKIFDSGQCPIPKELFSDNIYFHEFEENSTFNIGNTIVKTIECNHPGGSTGYRLDNNEWSMFFNGDHEHTSKYDESIKNILKDIDVAIVDASYTIEDYQHHIGWGHTPMETWIDIAKQTKIKHLIFTHFSVKYSDRFLNSIVPKYVKLGTPESIVSFAYENLEISQTNRHYVPQLQTPFEWVYEFMEKVSKYYDVSTILDVVLSEARKISNADAGTIYLVQENKLSFEYTQNDTLFKDYKDNKHLYVSSKMPINDSSIAGYVANNAILLNIEDVYKLDTSTPYAFNKSFDEITGYKTQSMLTIPLFGTSSEVIGVIQLINSMNDGNKSYFTRDVIDKIQLLTIVASSAIKKGQMSIDLVMRMIKMSELKDPKETGMHVKRVGVIAAELYAQWARVKNIDYDEAKIYKDTIKLAAMLHDVGKVGIPDAILKKPEKLTKEEFKNMQQHSYIGAKLFGNSHLFLDQMSYDIILHHHQKFNGKGYTGSSDIPILSGNDIPLCAQITSIADVYDALSSKRCYKEAFEKEKVLTIMKEESGKSFSPELIDCFFSILPTIEAIYEKFKDEEY